jgi:hypothetical protein
MPAQVLPRDGYYHGHVWQDSHGRYRCKRPDGTVGLIVGPRRRGTDRPGDDTHGERATGTILGAAQAHWSDARSIAAASNAIDRMIDFQLGWPAKPHP